MQFDLLEAVAECAVDNAPDPFQVAIVLQQGRINRDTIAPATAKQGRNWYSGKFAPDVPQGDVETTDGVNGGPRATEIVQGSLNPRRQLDIIDFLANRQWRNPLVDRRNDRRPKAAIGFTPAHRAAIGCDPYQNGIQRGAWLACERWRGAPMVKWNSQRERSDCSNPWCVHG